MQASKQIALPDYLRPATRLCMGKKHYSPHNPTPTTMQYEPLRTKFRRKGYDYEQVERTGDVAIYRQSLNGETIAYEVFEVRKYDERTIAGVILPATEAVPSDSQWGDNAYTVHTLRDARDKVTLIQENIAARQARALIKY